MMKKREAIFSRQIESSLFIFSKAVLFSGRIKIGASSKSETEPTGLKKDFFATNPAKQKNVNNVFQN